MIEFLKNIFKGKTQLEKLEDHHKDLLSKAFVLFNMVQSTNGYTLLGNRPCSFAFCYLP